MSWTALRKPGEQAHAWVAVIAPGVELVRVPWGGPMERVFVRVDGATLEPLRIEYPRVLRQERLALLVRNLARCGGRFEGASLPSEDEVEDEQGSLL